MSEIETITLFNKGERIIQHFYGELHPKQFVKLLKAEALRLKKLFPDELATENDAKETFSSPAATVQTTRLIPEQNSFESGLSSQKQEVATPLVTESVIPGPAPEAAIPATESLSEAEIQKLVDNADDLKENEDGSTTFTGKHSDGTAYEVTLPAIPVIIEPETESQE